MVLELFPKMLARVVPHQYQGTGEEDEGNVKIEVDVKIFLDGACQDRKAWEEEVQYHQGLGAVSRGSSGRGLLPARKGGDGGIGHGEKADG